MMSAALAPGTANALPAGYGKGPGYCSTYGNLASRYSFDDVYACVSPASVGPTPFDADGTESFQCVELSARFLWAIYGIWAGPGTGVRDGADLVAVVHRRDPRIRVGVPSAHSLPVAGDVVSLGPGGGVDARFGHTAIVIAARLRRGTFTIIGQNTPGGRAGKQTLTVDLHGHHDGRARLNGIWTVASWLELRVRPKRPRHRGAVSR
jgi:CHAP domain-containing protein